MKIAISLR